MASLFKRDESWVVQFDDADGNRRTVSLGRIAAASARSACGHIEHLAAAAFAGAAIPRDTAVWLAGIGDKLRDKLAAVRLTEPRKSATLQSFADSYVASRKDWSDAARTQFMLGVTDAVRFFGPTRSLASVTQADADAFRAELASRLAPATARKRMRFTKHLFQRAVRARILSENPFQDQKTANVVNRERLQFIDADTAMKVADELTGNARLVFLLARFAGLRTPSETYALKWADVSFDHETLRVFASKTGRTRMIPMLPAVRAALLAAFSDAPDGAEFVFQNRQPLPVIQRNVERAIVRAGVTRWPKLFQQLRASFATDCVRALPANAAAAILGHSAKVAAESYWTTDATDIASAAKALRNRTESAGIDATENPANRLQTVHTSELTGMLWKCSVGDTGFEPVTSCVSSTRSSQLS